MRHRNHPDAFCIATAIFGVTFPISCLISSIISSVQFGVGQVEVVTILYSIISCHSHVHMWYIILPSRPRYHPFWEASVPKTGRRLSHRSSRPSAKIREYRSLLPLYSDYPITLLTPALRRPFPFSSIYSASNISSTLLCELERFYLQGYPQFQYASGRR